MEIMTIAQEIRSKIKEIDSIRASIKERGIQKARTISEYEKALAVTIIKLKNGVEFVFEGEIISKPPVTILEKIARGICWKEKQSAEEAEALYKSATSNMQAVLAQLNADQSLFSKLDKG